MRIEEYPRFVRDSENVIEVGSTQCVSLKDIISIYKAVDDSGIHIVRIAYPGGVVEVCPGGEDQTLSYYEKIKDLWMLSQQVK